MNDTTITTDEKETRELGRKIARGLKPGSIIALHGELGSGKTTFTQGIAEGLGITRRIVSPTFLIQRSYVLPDKKGKMLYHLDLYRLQNEKEAENIGIHDLLESSDSFIIIEWPEKITSLLPTNTIHMYFEYLEETKRKIRQGS